MFIQCQNCQTTYKIDEHKIPEKKSVVRCAKCSELIPLNREKQDELLKKSPSKIVECDSCGTQYSVPLKTIKYESTRVKCGKCGNHFTVNRSDDQAEVPSSAHAYESDLDNDDIDLDNIDIPTGSEIEMDDLFGDVGPSDRNKAKKSKSGDANKDYLESIKLTKDGDSNFSDDDMGINEISKDHKYKIFLKPKSKKGKGDDTSDLDDLSDLEGTNGIIKPGKPGAGKKKGKAKKEISKSTKKRRNIFLWVIWALVVIALLALGWVVLTVKTREVYTKPQTEAFSNQSKIAILEPLNGRFITNQQIAGRIFVLDGKLYNVYGEDVVLSKIEIEGFLYTQDSDKPITAVSFAGVALDDSQLRTMNKIDIESELMSQSQDSNALKEFESNEMIDFQVVFFDAPDPDKVTKLGAKIKKFNRRKL